MTPPGPHFLNSNPCSLHIYDHVYIQTFKSSEKTCVSEGWNHFVCIFTIQHPPTPSGRRHRPPQTPLREASTKRSLRSLKLAHREKTKLCLRGLIFGIYMPGARKCLNWASGGSSSAFLWRTPENVQIGLPGAHF